MRAFRPENHVEKNAPFSPFIAQSVKAYLPLSHLQTNDHGYLVWLNIINRMFQHYAVWRASAGSWYLAALMARSHRKLGSIDFHG
jgi:hypothetical protein